MDSELFQKGDIQICCVISNEKNAYGIERAKARAIPYAIIPHQDYNSRNDFEMVLKTKIDTHQPDLIILAGFMRILSAGFVNCYPNQILNIHPSLLPKYPGLHTHEKVIANKDKVHGASIHFVTDKLDGGPVIVQKEILVLEQDTAESLQHKIHQIEYQLYPMVIGWYASGRLRCDANTVYLDNQALSERGYQG